MTKAEIEIPDRNTGKGTVEREIRQGHQLKYKEFVLFEVEHQKD